jgi:hypothetical protein
MHDAGPDEIAYGLGPVLISASPDQFVYFLGKLRVDCDGYALHEDLTDQIPVEYDLYRSTSYRTTCSVHGSAAASTMPSGGSSCVIGLLSRALSAVGLREMLR